MRKSGSSGNQLGVIAVLLIASARCFGQASTTLTLQDCVRLAEAAPSPITLARQEVQIAEHGLAAARASFLPQARLINGVTYNSAARAGTGLSGLAQNGSFVALNGLREYQSLLGTSLEIDVSGRLRAELARARADRQAANTSVALAERDLRRAVSIAYFGLLLARHLVAVSRQVLAEAEDFEQRTTTRFQAGEVAQADVIKAESQVAFLRQGVTSAELDARTANAELASFWTSDVDQDLTLAEALEKPSPPDSQSDGGTPYLKRLEFRLSDAQRAGLLAEYRRERSFLWPQVTFNFEYGIDANRLAWRDRGQAALLTLNIPVFDWFRARNAAEQFHLRASQVDTSRAIATRALSREYHAALDRAKSLYQQIALTDVQVRTSEDNLKMARVRYEGGEGPALDVVAAQTQLAQARTNHFATLAAYANARADLEVAAGR